MNGLFVECIREVVFGSSFFKTHHHVCLIVVLGGTPLGMHFLFAA